MSYEDVKSLPKGTRGVAFRNATNYLVNNELNGGDMTFKVGERIICRKSGLKGFTCNGTYRIVKVDEERISIENVITGKFIGDVKAGIVYKHFERDTMATCHSVMGKSIDGHVAIYEVDLPFVSAKWVWTSITRLRDCSKMHIVLGANNYKRELVNEIRSKVVGYLTQDTKRFDALGDQVKKEYVDTEYVFKMMCVNKLRCVECHQDMVGTWTLNRKDNALAHVKGNVELMCHHCNCSLK